MRVAFSTDLGISWREADVACDEGIDVAEVLRLAGFAKSRSEARRAIDQGGVRISDRFQKLRFKE